MLRIAAVAAAALLGAAVSASANAQGDAGEDCGVSTPEMVACLDAQTAHWDKELTVAYQKAMNDAPPAQKDKLREAERAWIRYRDANCAYYAAGEGNHRPCRSGRVPATHDQGARGRTVERRRRTGQSWQGRQGLVLPASS